MEHRENDQSRNEVSRNHRAGNDRGGNEAEPLTSPTVEVAKAYLDEATAVKRRRQERVDRRSLGWMNIANAVMTALFFTVTIDALRSRMTVVSTSLLFAFLLWGQFALGDAERRGVQLRFTRRRWLPVIGIGALVVVLLIVMGIIVFSDQDVPLALRLLPGGFALIGFSGWGLIQLWLSRGQDRARARAVPLPAESRVATVAIGVLLSLLTVAVAFPESPLAVVVVLIALTALVGWRLAGQRRFSPAALGEAWAWRQFLAFMTAFAVLATVGLLTVHGLADPFPLVLVAATGIITLHIIAAFLDGRDDR